MSRYRDQSSPLTAKGPCLRDPVPHCLTSGVQRTRTWDPHLRGGGRANSAIFKVRDLLVSVTQNTSHRCKSHVGFLCSVSMGLYTPPNTKMTSYFKSVTCYALRRAPHSPACTHSCWCKRRRSTDERRDVRSAGVADWKAARRGNTERTLTAAAGPSPCCDPYRQALAMRPSLRVRPLVS